MANRKTKSTKQLKKSAFMNDGEEAVGTIKLDGEDVKEVEPTDREQRAI